MPDLRALTPTSYAVLGLLAIRPWTTYELAKQMQRTLHYYWPRAESRLYDEPKNLVAHGLATADKSVVGRRPRTIYTITSSGEQALRAWLATPSVGPSLESAAIVKVFCAVHGTKAELLSTIETIRAQGLMMRRHGTQVAQEYADARNAFPERMHTSALMFDFLWQYSGALIQWAERATQAVSAWDGLAPEGKVAWAMQVFSQPLDVAGTDALGADS